MPQLPNPQALFLAFIRRRYQAWWQARLPLADQIKLTQHNVYILPTGPGLMLVATLVTLLIASINYQLSLGYVLTFSLAGSALVGMFMAHNTLRGLMMDLGSPTAQFAGSPVAIDIRLHNPDKSVRYALILAIKQSQKSKNTLVKTVLCTDVPAQGSCSLQLTFTTQQRGLQRLPSVTIETRYPLGSVKVWAYWRPAAQVMIYPRPEANPPPLPLSTDMVSAENRHAEQAQNSADWGAIRSYRRGDPLKQVIWKKAAKADQSGDALVVRIAQPNAQKELYLDINQTGTLSTEARISRLCAWVLEAQAQGLSYGLRLPGLDISPAAGLTQQRRCLEALALC